MTTPSKPLNFNLMDTSDLFSVAVVAGVIKTAINFFSSSDPTKIATVVSCGQPPVTQNSSGFLDACY